MPWGDVLALNQ